MARGTSPATPITDDDLPGLREQVNAGEAPVAYLLVDTAVAPAGARVAVLRVDEPATATDDCVTVRLGDDELPFAPKELSLRPLRRARKPAAVPGTPLRASSPATRPSTSTEGSVFARPSTNGRGTGIGGVPPAPVPSAVPPSSSPTVNPAAPPDPSSASGEAAPVRRPRPGRSPSLAVTLRFSGSAWTLEHSAGGRKSTPRPVSPAAVRALADRVEDSDIRKSLLDAVERSRRHAAEEAAALRAQLAAVETVLAELDD